jgi:hypothetical protein
VCVIVCESVCASLSLCVCARVRVCLCMRARVGVCVFACVFVCTCQVGEMKEAITAWNKVVAVSELMSREAEATEAKIASFQNLAVAWEVMGNLVEAVRIIRERGGGASE